MTDDDLNVGTELNRLNEAAARIAFLAAKAYQASEPEKYAVMCSGFNKGLLESVVVVHLSPRPCVQICMEGADGVRHIFATLPMKQVGAGGATVN